MFRVGYNLGIELFILLTTLFSLTNDKAKSRIHGNKHWKTLGRDLFKGKNPIWIHCSSIGEFEQARPIIEAIKQESSAPPVLLSFFSPSGFQLRNSYPRVDAVTYLPFDRLADMRSFVTWANPACALVIKYELWFNMLSCLAERNIPTALVSAHFQQGHWVFRYSSIGRRLSMFSRIFAQNLETANRLEQLGLTNSAISGDTRFDRVVAVANTSFDHSNLEQWSDGNNTLVVGSNWPEDDEIIMSTISEMSSLNVIVAPHEINEKQMAKWVEKFGDELTLFSRLNDNILSSTRIILIDCIGLLSKLYRYATIAYVGGGFGSAVHNTLEAAVYSVPVIFGPNNQRFHEVQQLKELGIGMEVSSTDDFKAAIEKSIHDLEWRSEVARKSEQYFRENSGATEKVMNWIGSLSLRN